MQPRFFALCVACFCAASSLVQAQESGFRPNLPGVLRPVPSVDAQAIEKSEAAIIAAFRGAYAQAQTPRIAIFWNRELSDTPSTAYRRFLAMDHINVAHISPANNAAAAMQVSQIENGETATSDAQRPAAMSGAQAFHVESGFNSLMLESGAVLLDRNTIMRLQAVQPKTDVRNVQALEMQALKDKADIFISILQSDDPQSPIGAALQVKVIEVRTGRILAQITPDQFSKRATSTQFVAGGYGFDKQQRAAPTLNAAEIGKALALATMQALTPALR